MGFEKFTKKGRGLKPLASVRTNGQLGMNRGCIERFGLVTETVALYYDSETKRIGIELGVDANDDGAHRLVVRPNNAFIGARPFLNWYGIQYEEKTKRYEVTRTEDGRMLIVDLKRPVQGLRESRKAGRTLGEQEEGDALS